MDEPSALTLAFRAFMFFLGALGMPQVAAVMFLRWAWRKQRNILLIPALLVAPAIFFAAAYVFWGMQAEAIRAEGNYVCGTFGAVASFSTIWDTALNHCLSGAVLFFMWLSAERRRRPFGGAT